MAGLWETLPASPCSAASDDAAMRSTKHHAVTVTAPTKSQVLLNTLPAGTDLSSPSATPVSSHRAPSSPPVAKRARVDVSPRTTRAVSMHMDKSSPCPDSTGDLSETVRENDDLEEKRKALQERLAIIKAQKAQLAARSPSPDDEVTVVEENSTISRPSVQTRRQSGRKVTKPQSEQDVIDVDDDTVAVRPLAQPKSAKGTKSSKSGSRPAAKSLYDADLAAFGKRTSSRVRRPRTPNLILEDNAGKSAPLPNVMGKCKRLQFCKKLIGTMLRDSSAAPFSAPVKELWHEQAIPRYFDVITHPMDLRSVKKNLDTMMFIRPSKEDVLPFRFDVENFADDVRLVFRNAMVYNRAGDPLHNAAQSLLEAFEKTLSEKLPPLPCPSQSGSRSLPKKRAAPARSTPKGQDVSSKSRTRRSQDTTRSTTSRKPRAPSTWDDVSNDHELEGMSVSELRDRLNYLNRCRIPVKARTPIPKGSGYLSRAAVLYDVDMSYAEKMKVRTSFDKVPASKMESLVAMIKKTCASANEQTSEEFEFDLDCADNKTMRNIEAFMEQFAPGFKTIRSSTLGREFHTVEQVDAEIRKVRTRLSSVAKPKKQSADPAASNRSFFSPADAQESSDSSSDSSSGEESDSSDESGAESD